MKMLSKRQLCELYYLKEVKLEKARATNHKFFIKLKCENFSSLENE